MSQDQFTTRIATVLVGLVAIIVCIGAIILAAQGDTIPDALIAIGAAAGGALAALIVPGRA
jgi:hypothetical protein